MAEEPLYKKLERRGEEIYDELYDKGGHGLLSEIKECFEGAIAAAAAGGLATEAARLRKRLDHIVEGYRRHVAQPSPTLRAPTAAERAAGKLAILLGSQLVAVQRAALTFRFQFDSSAAWRETRHWVLAVQCAWRLDGRDGAITGSSDVWEYGGTGTPPAGWSFLDGNSAFDRALDRWMGGYDPATGIWRHEGGGFAVDDVWDLRGDLFVGLAGGDQLRIFPDAAAAESWRVTTPDEDAGNGQALVFPPRQQRA